MHKQKNKIMESLTKVEEKVMHILWKIKKGFVKDVLNELPEPKPPYNTISSVIRILVQKEFVTFKAYGKTYEYYPKISKIAYKRYTFSQLLKNYFDGSYENMVSYMVKEEEISENELHEIKKLLDNQNSNE